MKLPSWVLEGKRKRIERSLRDKHPFEVIRYLNNRLGSFSQYDYFDLLSYKTGIPRGKVPTCFTLWLKFPMYHTWLLELEDSEIRSLLTLIKLSR
jgi:hypothetical protein